MTHGTIVRIRSALTIVAVLAILTVPLVMCSCAAQPNTAGAQDGQDRLRVINNEGTLVLVESVVLHGAEGGTLPGSILWGSLAGTITNSRGNNNGDSTASGSQTGATTQEANQQGGPTSAEGTLEVPIIPGG